MILRRISITWWRHPMETFSALLAICAGNSPVTGEFPAQRPVTWSFDVFYDLRPNKRLSKQWWGWWFEAPSCPLRRHCYDTWKSLNKMAQEDNVVHMRSCICPMTMKSVVIQNRWNFNLLLSKSGWADRCRVMHTTRQPCCRGMCKQVHWNRCHELKELQWC